MESTYISLIKFYIEKCSNQPLYSTSKVDTDCKISFCVLFSSSLHSSKTDNRSEEKKHLSFLFLGWRFWFFSREKKTMFKSWRNDKNKIKAVFKLQFQATQVCVFVSLKIKTQYSDNGFWLRSVKVSRFAFVYMNVEN